MLKLHKLDSALSNKKGLEGQELVVFISCVISFNMLAKLQFYLWMGDKGPMRLLMAKPLFFSVRNDGCGMGECGKWGE